ncbi:MAG: hypothetical protein ACOCQ1_00825 [Halanaerobiaceae bacterium]
MNKSKIYILLLALISISILFTSCNILEEKEYKIGKLDRENLLSESKRAEQLSQELNDIGNDLQTEYESRENSDDEEDDEALDQVYQQFSSQKKELEDRLNQEIKEVLKTIRDEKELNVIVHKESVHYGGIDITGEVVELLDEKFYPEGDGDDGES